MWGEHIWVKVIANNIVGPSVESNPGNGAMIITAPDAPLNVLEQTQYRTKSILSIKWDEGAANGGTPVIDYRVSIAENLVGEFTSIVDGLQATSFTIVSLNFGIIYDFKIESRNIYGYSEFSEILTLLCAYKPEPTPAPWTTNQND